MKPKFEHGGWSSESADGRGCAGHFIALEWLGLRLDIAVGSLAAHQRYIDRIRGR